MAKGKSIRVTRDAIDALHYMDALYKDHAKKYGKVFEGVFEVGQIGKAALAALVEIACTFWRRAEKGAPFRGHLEVTMPNGVAVHITREDLPAFFGQHVPDTELAKQAGGTIQKALQAFGCAHYSFNGDPLRIQDAIGELAQGHPTPSGILEAAKDKEGPKWAEPLRTAPKPSAGEKTRGQQWVDSLVKRLSFIGLDAATRRDLEKKPGSIRGKDWLMDMTIQELQPLVASVGKAEYRLSKIAQVQAAEAFARAAEAHGEIEELVEQAA